MEKASSRLKVVALLVAFMFAALTTRLWFLQVLAVAQNREEALNNSVRIVETDALRGTILDAKGRPLVENRMSLEVRVRGDQLGPNAEHVLLDLSKLIGVPVKSITRALQDKQYSPLQPKPVAEFVPERVKWYLDEHADEFPGVSVVPTSVRAYSWARDHHDPEFAAHVLGYLAQINDAELKDPKFKGYGVSDLVGRSGLEQEYEKYLRGERGAQKYVVNSDQEIIRTLGEEPPTPGHNLVLALDADIQQAAEEELQNGIDRARTIVDEQSGTYLKADGGAVIVLDAQTSGIVAMASWPAYNPEWFVKGLTPQQNNYLNGDNTLAPALNRVTQQIYAPGSTFKPFVALSAAKEGLANFSNYAYDCPAEYVVPGDTSGASFGNWSTSGLGYMSIAQALKVSCDTVFYDFGTQFFFNWRDNPLGKNSEPFQRDLRQFGFGKPTGVDLPLEADGIVPDAKFMLDHPELYPDGPIPGVNILLSIGSGEMRATPMQLATAYLALANGGHMCKPHLVDRIENAQGDTVKQVGTKCYADLPYTQGELDYIVQDGLSQVTQSGGTAGLAFSGFPLSTIPVAGKTGTAERPPFQDTSWFAAIVPAYQPKYVVIAMVEQGGFGSTTAAPIVRHVIERMYDLPVSGPVSGGSQD
ncbi:MAG: penicillin-binding protein 2 [Actinomycetota bacterium]